MAVELVNQGRQTFRFVTFGDQAFWSGTLKPHEAIEGAGLGGIGLGVSPMTALAAGLKIDIDALPSDLREHLLHAKVNLNDPTVTVALLKSNAVVGVSGFFDSNGALQSAGIQCGFNHSMVDAASSALCAGAIQPIAGTACIGHRFAGGLDRNLNVDPIVPLTPDLSVFVNLLKTTQATGRTVLNGWAPGKFDAELILDGKASHPQPATDGKVTGNDVTGAVLIPPVFEPGGVNLHRGQRVSEISPGCAPNVSERSM